MRSQKTAEPQQIRGFHTRFGVVFGRYEGARNSAIFHTAARYA